jgi:hypothetical protein
LGYRPGALIGPAGLTTRLRILIAIASRAEVPDQPPNRGPKEKDHPRSIARMTAEHYYRLTGDKPHVNTNPGTRKAYGPFLVLLTEIYAALGIEASAESQARAVGEEFNARAASDAKEKIR